jgi:DNA (cytosine-5)-methyltransferase 1
VQSWKNPGKKWGRYGKNRQYLYRCPACAGEVTPYYYCAANAIDWSLPSVRIGEREEYGKQPLKPKTLERVRVGLEKYGREPFVVSYYTRSNGKAATSPLVESLPTQPTWPVHYLVDLGHTHAEHPGKVHRITEAIPTQTTGQTIGLVCPLVVPLDYTDKEPRPVTEPWPTQTAQQSLAFVVSMRDAPDYPLKHITEPLPTQSTIGAPYLVELHGSSVAHPVTDPLGCILAGGGHHGLVMPQPFIVSYYSGSDQARPVTEPVATVSTVDRHGLVQPASPTVEDCYFRMLKSHEIGQAMAFPNTYKVLGNERERVKQFGNAVTPPAMQMILERCIETFRD